MATTGRQFLLTFTNITNKLHFIKNIEKSKKIYLNKSS